MFIRPATPDDAAPIASILNEYVAIGGITGIQHAISIQDQRDIIENLPMNASFLVAVDEDSNKIIGFQFVEPHDDLPAAIGSIATYSKIGASQKGVGTALFTRSRKAAVKLGYNELNATIRADNTGGLKYYDKMGFQDHSVAHGIPLKDGTPVDRISKRLAL